MNKPAELPSSAAPPTAESLAMIDRLIAFPTVSRDSNLGLIEYARDELARLGVRANLIYDSARKKANLFATLSAGLPLMGDLQVCSSGGDSSRSA